MKKFTRGFTLIELLVVIAIIGILSSIILVSLGSARSKGKDSAVKESLSGVRSQMELYANGGGYTNGCSTSAGNPGGALTILNGIVTIAPVTMVATVNTTAAIAGTYQTVSCHDAASTWVADAPLSASTSGSPSMWCVDSTGVAKVESAAMLANATACI